MQSYFRGHNWDVQNGFNYVLQFFSLISDGVGGVSSGYLQTYSHFEIMAIQVGIVQPPSTFTGTGSELQKYCRKINLIFYLISQVLLGRFRFLTFTCDGSYEDA